MQPSLQDFFGDSVTQDESALVITKADLPYLTPLANNTAQSLVIALLNKILSYSGDYLTDNNGNLLVDENFCPLTYDNKLDSDFVQLFRWRLRYILFNNHIHKQQQLVFLEKKEYLNQ